MLHDEPALLDDVTSKRVWQRLQTRFPDQPLTPATRLQADLGIDSIQWMDVTLDIGRTCGIELRDDALPQTQTVGDLLKLASQAKAIDPQDLTSRSPLDQPEETLGSESTFWLAPLGALELAAGWCLYAVNWVLMRLLFRIRIAGLENVPLATPLVITPHHTSYLDSLVLGAVLPFGLLKQTYWAAWTGVGYGPLFRVLRRWTHVVPVDVARGALSSLAYGAAIRKRGQNLIWFPEGQISRAGEVLPLKRGLGLLLARYPAGVVMVNIEGTREALPYGHRIPRPGRVAITFSQPLDSQELERTGNGTEAHERITDALQRELLRFCT